MRGVLIVGLLLLLSVQLCRAVSNNTRGYRDCTTSRVTLSVPLRGTGRYLPVVDPRIVFDLERIQITLEQDLPERPSSFDEAVVRDALELQRELTLQLIAPFANSVLLWRGEGVDVPFPLLEGREQQTVRFIPTLEILSRNCFRTLDPITRHEPGVRLISCEVFAQEGFSGSYVGHVDRISDCGHCPSQ